MDIKIAIGCRVATLRKRRKMRQEELAEALGMQRTSVTNLEAGRQNITLTTAYDIARVLGVEIVELFPPELYGQLDEMARAEIQELRARVEELEAVVLKIRQLVI